MAKFFLLTALFAANASAMAAGHPYSKCQKFLSGSKEIALSIKAPTPVQFDFPGVQVASLADPTFSTGATLFFFPDGGAETVYDARGGSVAASETTLLDEGSYSHNVDGIFFAGGSTMGLAVGDGVRERIFKMRAENASAFDFIPSVPGAVVFDYGGRIAPFNDALVYPGREMGHQLFDALSSTTFLAGRYGAGTTTTFGKMNLPRWGGQGLAMAQVGRYKVMTAVVLNASGDVFEMNGLRIGERLATPRSYLKPPAGPRQNTTLSLVVTDAPLNRDQLKRLAVMVHTSMGAWIRPFQTATDGDILFASSTAPLTKVSASGTSELEMELGIAAANLMQRAITTAIEASNEGVGGN